MSGLRKRIQGSEKVDTSTTQGAVAEKVAPVTKTSSTVTEEKANSYYDVLIVTVLIVLGCATRWYNIGFPREIVFDELHFGKFVSHYYTGEYYLDIHPPLGKYILWIPSYLFGYDGSYPFLNIGDKYPEAVPYVQMRMTHALSTVFVVPISYIVCRTANLSRSSASLVAWLFLCETAMITQSRWILMDGFLLFFGMCCICCSFKVASSKAFSFGWYLWLLLLGCSMGCAVSIKYTGLGFLGFCGIHQLFVMASEYIPFSRTSSWKVYQPKRRESFAVVARHLIWNVITRLVLCVVPLVVLFLGFWIAHVVLLPYSGSGNMYHTPAFLAQLKEPDGSDVPRADYNAPKMSILDRVFEIVHTMHAVNMGLTVKHPHESTWDQWPLLTAKGVLFWSKGDVAKKSGVWVFLQGNPMVFWFSFFIGVVGSLWVTCLVVSHLFGSVVSRHDGDEDENENQGKGKNRGSTMGMMDVFCDEVVQKDLHVLCLVVGYVGNMVPFALVPRSTWVYHYLPALEFAVLLSGFVFDIFLRTAYRLGDFPVFLVKMFGFIAITLTGFFFIYFCPWVYGLPMHFSQHDGRFWMNVWKP